MDIQPVFNPTTNAIQGWVQPTPYVSGGMYTQFRNNWVVVLLALLMVIDYIILWSRLPFVYGVLVAGTLPFAAALVYSIHRLLQDPGVKKTLGLKGFIFAVGLYLGSFAYFAGKIPRQVCTLSQ